MNTVENLVVSPSKVWPMVFVGVLALWLLGLASAPALAHYVPARRSITIQAEEHEAAVLITWTSARGSQGAELLARAAWGRRSRANDALRNLAANEALRGLHLTLDDQPVRPATTHIKMRVERPTARDPMRVFVAVLLTVQIGPGQSLALAVRGGASSQLRWHRQTKLDHKLDSSSTRCDLSSSKSNHRICSMAAEKMWIRHRTLRIEWPGQSQ